MQWYYNGQLEAGKKVMASYDLTFNGASASETKTVAKGMVGEIVKVNGNHCNVRFNGEMFYDIPEYGVIVIGD